MAATLASVASEDRTLRATDVCRLAGCTFRQLDHWIRQYPIHAGRTSVEGGSPRLRFTPAEARVVRAMVRLGAAGCMATAHVHTIMSALAKCPDAAWVVIATGGGWATSDPARVVDELSLDDTTIVVPLAFVDDKEL